MISQRTKAALAQAKARGTRLGNPRIEEALALANAANPRHQSHLLPTAPALLRLMKTLVDQGEGLYTPSPAS